MRPRTARSRGFSLVELLVTIAILAIIALIGLVEVQKAFKRQRLASAAQSVEQLARRTYTLMQSSNRVQFLYLAAYDATQGTPLLIVEDADSDGFPDASEIANAVTAGVAGGRMYVIPTGTGRDVSLSTVDVDQVQSVNWAYVNLANPPPNPNPTGNTAGNERWLRCDYLGRASNDNLGTLSGNQIPSTATLTLTHRDEVTTPGVLGHALVYTVSINPVWQVFTSRPPA